MTDARLRELEQRWRATGSEADLGLYLRERLRSGTPVAQLHLAAICGLQLPAGLVDPLLVPISDAERLFGRRPSTLKRWGGVVDVDGEARFDLVEVLRHRVRTKRRAFENLPFLVRAVVYLDRPSAAQALRIALQELLLDDWLRRAPGSRAPLEALCVALARFSGGDPPDVSRSAGEAAQLLKAAPGGALLRDLPAALHDLGRVEPTLLEAVSARARVLEQATPESFSVVRASAEAQLLGALRRGLREWVLGQEEEAPAVEREPVADPVAAAWDRWRSERGLDDEVASLAGRVASGELPLPKLEVAAVCGHGPAQRALEQIEDRELLSTKEAATVYGLTTSGIGGWARIGCPVTKQGRRNLFDLVRVIAWLRARDAPVPRGLLECFMRTVRHYDVEAARRIEAALDEAGLGDCRSQYNGGPDVLDVRRRADAVSRVAIVPWALGYA